MKTPNYLPGGTVYGTLLNFRREHALWAPRMHEAPYKAPPNAPVLYIKTANTFTRSGHAISLAPGVTEVEVAASLGLVAGEGGVVAGAVLLNDVAVPHESYYRPPVKFRCVDGFLGVGDAVRPVASLDELSSLVLELRVDGVMRQRTALADLIRDAATLWADVNAFQSMRPGDVLMVGTDCLEDGTRPRVKVGDAVEITATGFSPLVNHFIQEPPDAGPPQVGRAPRGGSEHASAPSMGVKSS
jgi:5-oxopent-3-ene-1,2,5-tricarboxylate decarboxylase / 2-hydroxyhepta-2,4-diene-1,7-dioate isomerase